MIAGVRPQQAIFNEKRRWNFSEIVGFARFFFMNSEDRLDVLLGYREI